MRCPVCDCPNVDDAVQCGRCGAPLKAAGGREPHHLHLRDVEESTWFKSSLILVTALLAALALGGAWWSLMHSGVDEARDEPLKAQSSSSITQPAQTVADATQPASAATSAAQPAMPDGVLAGASETPPAAASTPAAAVLAPASGSAANVPPAEPVPRPAARQPPEAVAGYVDSSGKDLGAAPPGNAAFAAAPAASAQVMVRPTQPASSPVANSVAARLAMCNRFAWYQVLEHESCVWAICDGRWGRDGCPAYRQNPPGGN